MLRCIFSGGPCAYAERGKSNPLHGKSNRCPSAFSCLWRVRCAHVHSFCNAKFFYAWYTGTWSQPNTFEDLNLMRCFGMVSHQWGLASKFLKWIRTFLLKDPKGPNCMVRLMTSPFCWKLSLLTMGGAWGGGREKFVYTHAFATCCASVCVFYKLLLFPHF